MVDTATYRYTGMSPATDWRELFFKHLWELCSTFDTKQGKRNSTERKVILIKNRQKFGDGISLKICFPKTRTVEKIKDCFSYLIGGINKNRLCSMTCGGDETIMTMSSGKYP